METSDKTSVARLPICDSSGRVGRGDVERRCHFVAVLAQVVNLALRRRQHIHHRLLRSSR